MTRAPAARPHARRPRIAYLANVRLPTEKAHGAQIFQMCHAFSDVGADVVVLHPRRRQTDAALRGADAFAYYGVPRTFELRTVANVDVIALTDRLPRPLAAAIAVGHAVIWGRWAVQAAQALDADLYYTRDVATAYWLTRAGLPTAFEAHGLPHHVQRRLLSRVGRAPSLHLAAAVTSYIGSGLVELGFPEDRTMLAPDGVDLSRFAPVPAAAACRAQLGLPGDRPIVGYVGRFRALGLEKGIVELVAAVGALRRSTALRPLLLCVGGPLDALELYRRTAHEQGLADDDVLIHDRVPASAVPTWIAACDVLTLPSPRNEFSAYHTSPLKLFEYMASSRPIVASDLPALRDVLRPGDNAVLVAPGDPSALASALARVLTDDALARRLAASARADVDAYAWTRRAARILARAA